MLNKTLRAGKLVLYELIQLVKLVLDGAVYRFFYTRPFDGNCHHIFISLHF